MAVTAFWYGEGLRRIVSGVGDGTPIVWTTDNIKVAMTTSTYVPDQDLDQDFGDVTNEVTGTGYTQGGDLLASKTQDYTAGTNIVKLDAADTVWATSTIANAAVAVIYKDTGTPATSPLLGYVLFGQDESSSAADFTITWSSDGILRVTAA